MRAGSTDMTDQELLMRFRQTGDNRWLGMLFTRYSLLVFAVCMKYLKNEEDAKDCTQQVFEKAISEIEKYEISFFKSWIYKVTQNQCLMRLREKNKTTEELSAAHLTDSTEESKTSEIQQKEIMLSQMHDAMQQLNTEQRTCIELFYLHHKSYQEIARLTGYTLLQVKSYIQNGKRNLKLKLLQYKQHE